MVSAHDLRQLRTELRDSGVFEYRELSGWLRLALLLAAIAACLTAAATLPLWTAVAWLPVLVLALTTTAMLGHEGVHSSFSPSPRRNRLMSLITFPLLSGLGARYWRHKHNVLHHGHPNVHGTDPDIDPWPMVTSRDAYLKSPLPLRWFQRRAQHIAFWPMTLLLPIVMRTPSITFLVRESRRGRRSLDWWLDAACLTIHYGLWLGLGFYLFGVWALLLYAVAWSLVGTCLALIFAPAHIGLPVVVGPSKGWAHQLATTRNLRVPRGLRWFFVGLDFQIEHHMFPKIPHQNLPVARDIVRAWCRERGLPHDTVGYGAALRDVFATLRDAWKTPAVSAEELDRMRGIAVGAVPRRAAAAS